MGFLIAMVTTNDEVTASLCAAGRFTLPLYEVVNLAPFVTSFSTKLMASWQLYGRHVLRVVMQCNYMEANLMNPVNVPALLFTLMASDRLSLSSGVK